MTRLLAKSGVQDPELVRYLDSVAVVSDSPWQCLPMWVDATESAAPAYWAPRSMAAHQESLEIPQSVVEPIGKIPLYRRLEPTSEYYRSGCRFSATNPSRRSPFPDPLHCGCSGNRPRASWCTDNSGSTVPSTVAKADR